MKNKASIFLIFVFIPVIIFAESCKRQEKDWRGTIEEVEGVTIVKNPLEPMSEDFIIDFEASLTLGEESGDDYLMFRNELDIAVDNKGNMFILDIGNQRLLKFDKRGEFIWETGRAGQGPGEFQSRPSSYSYSIDLAPSEDIAIEDGKLIHFFDQSGNFLRTSTIEKRIWGFDFVPDGRLLVSIGLINKIGNSAAFYSEKGEYLSEFPDEYIYDTIQAGVGIECGSNYLATSDRIYVSLPGPYEIREYTLDGNLIRKVCRDLKIESPFVKTLEEGRRWQSSDVSGPCFVTPDGMIVNFVTLVEEKGERKRMMGDREVTSPILEFNRFLDIFNEKGQFLGSYTLNGKELKLIDNEGNFYFSEADPFPRIVRARLKTSERKEP